MFRFFAALALIAFAVTSAAQTQSDLCNYLERTVAGTPLDIVAQYPTLHPVRAVAGMQLYADQVQLYQSEHGFVQLGYKTTAEGQVYNGEFIVSRGKPACMRWTWYQGLTQTINVETALRTPKHQP